ncbi:MAG: hypothetical protein H7066_18965 [Cytophagaceae bacterium]|nr:hypothetical protein [Gemmatimonadaceae bacterium]
MRARNVTQFVMAAFILAGAGAAGAQATGRPTSVGPRVTYNFDAEAVGIGGHALVPLSTNVDFYPSIDIFLPDNGSLLGANLDFRVHPMPRDAAMLYLGAGLNLMRASAGGSSNTEAGLNLLGGLEARTGVIRPFGELRLMVGDGSSVALAGGLNIIIGRR